MLKRIGFLGLLSLCILGCVGGNRAAGALLRPLRVPVVGGPGVPSEGFTVTTADGLLLDGWFLSPRETPRAVLVLVHGKDINRQHFVEPALAFLKKGVSVALYDQRAHGRSQGEFVTYGAKEVGDLRLVIDAALQKWGEALPVFVVGESLGAAVCLQTAAVDSRIKGVVAGAAFADLSTLVDRRASFFMGPAGKAEALAIAEEAAGFRVSEISPARAAAHITVPTLILHGTNDTFIPLPHAFRIYEALAGPKEMVRLDGVGHIDILLTDQAWVQIDRFVFQTMRNIYEKIQ